MKWVGLDVCVWEQDRELEEGARLEEDKGNVGSDLTMERKKNPNLWKVAEKVAEKDPLPPWMK